MGKTAGVAVKENTASTSSSCSSSSSSLLMSFRTPSKNAARERETGSEDLAVGRVRALGTRFSGYLE